VADETIPALYYAWLQSLHVMPALVAGIHVFLCGVKTWMAGTKPGHDD
jgi:hypothetical protein